MAIFSLGIFLNPFSISAGQSLVSSSPIWASLVSISATRVKDSGTSRYRQSLTKGTLSHVFSMSERAVTITWR